MGNQMQKSIADTGDKLQTSYTFEIDNFFDKKASIESPKFLSGGCEWNIVIYPDGKDSADHLRLCLSVYQNLFFFLRTGWKRKANFRFSLLNQSGKVLYSGTEYRSILFCSQFSTLGHKTLPLSKLKEEGILEKNKLIVKVEVKVVEIVHESKVTGREMFDVQGFNVIYSQVLPVQWIFQRHPDIAVDFKPKDKDVKTAYMMQRIYLPWAVGLLSTILRIAYIFHIHLYRDNYKSL